MGPPDGATGLNTRAGLPIAILQRRDVEFKRQVARLLFDSSNASGRFRDPLNERMIFASSPSYPIVSFRQIDQLTTTAISRHSYKTHIDPDEASAAADTIAIADTDRFRCVTSAIICGQM